MKQKIKAHLKANKRIYLLLAALAVLGAALGFLCVSLFGEQLRLVLGERFSAYFASAETLASDRISYLQSCVVRELKWFGALYLLGMSALGAVYSLMYCTFRGFAVGFAAANLLNSYGARGISFAFAAIAPRLVFSASAVLFSCALAFAMSLRLSSGNTGGKTKKTKLVYYAIYTGLMAVSFALSLLGALAETYISLKYILILAPKMI